MQQIDPAIQKLIEDGRQTIEAQETERRQIAQRKAEQERQEWGAAWGALKTAVAEQLPAGLFKFVHIDREGALHTNVYLSVNIPHLHPFKVQVTKFTNWRIHGYHINPHSVTGSNLISRSFNARDLHLCLAEVARLTEWYTARRAMILDYETAVKQWHKEHEAVTAVHEALTYTLQQQICEHYGDSFALWQVHFAYFEGNEVHTDTAVVLENETSPLGFWRVVQKWDGEVTRMGYANVFAIEALGEFPVIGGSYTIRLYDHDDIGLGTIYLPPYLTAEEIKTAKAMYAEVIEKAPELPEKPHPRTFEGAELFEEWELDWLYNSTQGGDADE